MRRVTTDTTTLIDEFRNFTTIAAYYKSKK